MLRPRMMQAQATHRAFQVIFLKRPPIAGQDGEPMEEDRIVPKDPDEAVVNVDGSNLTIDSSLRALRVGCQYFGTFKERQQT